MSGRQAPFKLKGAPMAKGKHTLEQSVPSGQTGVKGSLKATTTTETQLGNVVGTTVGITLTLPSKTY